MLGSTASRKTHRLCSHQRGAIGRMGISCIHIAQESPQSRRTIVIHSPGQGPPEARHIPPFDEDWVSGLAIAGVKTQPDTITRIYKGDCGLSGSSAYEPHRLAGHGMNHGRCFGIELPPIDALNRHAVTLRDLERNRLRCRERSSTTADRCSGDSRFDLSSSSPSAMALAHSGRWRLVMKELGQRSGRHVAEFVDDQKLVGGELALDPEQPLLVARLQQLVHERGREADRQPALAGGKTETERDMALAGAGVAERDDVLAALDVFRAGEPP
jgi:hypothetical protein